jgi:hypothetical protein
VETEEGLAIENRFQQTIFRLTAVFSSSKTAHPPQIFGGRRIFSSSGLAIKQNMAP